MNDPSPPRARLRSVAPPLLVYLRAPKARGACISAPARLQAHNTDSQDVETELRCLKPHPPGPLSACGEGVSVAPACRSPLRLRRSSSPSPLGEGARG